MRKVLLISPHFDDAVLSAGQFMAGRPDADVVTVFAGMPQNPGIQTTYDAKCGFENAEKAVEGRRYEDSQSLALLRAKPIHLDFPDGQYGEGLDEEQLLAELAIILTKEDYEFILAPVGLGHPDHVKVAEVVKKLAFEGPKYFWEDLPLRVVDPLLVPPRIKKMGLKEIANVGGGPIADKIRALSCYTSQIGTGILDPYVMYVPERFWK